MTAQLSFRKIASVAGLITALLIIFTFIAAENAIAAGSISENGSNTPDHSLQGSRAEAFDCSTVTEIPQQECEALVSLYNDTNGDNWTKNDGWLTTNTPCNWHGVTCAGGSVNEIKLGDNRLTGTLPPQLGDLAGLTLLHLYKNQLAGSLPLEWGNLSQLINLNLERNELTGPLPAAWGSMASLEVLQLFTNQLNGELPPELGDMSSLETLGLYGNQFSGPIPAELGQLHALTGILLYGNNLSGPIPPELGDLFTLESLDLASNNLTGPIPPELGNLPYLQTLNLAHNRLSGEIPVGLSKLLALKNLYLSDNLLTGPIPDLTPLSFSLLKLYLDSNRLTEGIPSELGNLTELTHLNLGNNHLGGPIPPELGNLKKLEHLQLYTNQLDGSIPTELGDLSNLSMLQLHANQLTGQIPVELCNLHNLIQLNLQDNLFSGPIPRCFGNLKKLKILDLFNNQFSGDLPSELGDMSALENLSLYNNQFTGLIPATLGNLDNLKAMHLNHNLLEGSIPPELGNLQKLDTLKLSSNLLTGIIPPALGNLSKLRTLLLNYNLLSGEIPPELSNLPLLYTLTLSNNQLSGPIPPELGSMPAIYRMNLGYNQLSGKIPIELGMLATLRELRLNATGLSGPLPRELTNLNLNVFWFDDTYICIPNDPVILNWLETIPDLRSTEVTCPSIFVTKTASQYTAAAGDTIHYSIKIASTITTSVDFTESLDADTTFVEITLPDGAVYDDTTHEIHFNQPVLAPGEEIKIEYVVRVNDNVTAGTVLQAMTTASGDDGNPIQLPIFVVVPHTTDLKTLVLIYAIGDNNLADDMIRMLNNAEAGLVGADPSAVKVELLLDGPDEDDTYLYTLQPDSTPYCPGLTDPYCNGRYVEQQNIEKWKTDDMATPGQLAGFMQQAIQKYPHAEQIVVSLVGHGSGWSPNPLPPLPSQWSDKAYDGLLWDRHPVERTLSTKELGEALQLTYESTGRKIDLLFLDACSMAMVEVGYEVHDNVNLLLASENWSWAAFPYDAHIAAIDSTKDARAIGLNWLQTEATRLASEPGHPYTISLMDLTQIEELRMAIDELGLALMREIPTGKDKIQQIHAVTDCFESNYDTVIDEKDNYCDLKSLAEQAQIEFSANSAVTIAAQGVLSQIETAVIDEAHKGGVPWPLGFTAEWTWGDIGGLSIYTPFNPEYDDWKRPFYSANHLRFALDSTWDQLVAKFWEGVDFRKPACTLDCPEPTEPLPVKESAPVYRIYLPIVFDCPRVDGDVEIICYFPD